MKNLLLWGAIATLLSACGGSGSSGDSGTGAGTLRVKNDSICMIEVIGVFSELGEEDYRVELAPGESTDILLAPTAWDVNARPRIEDILTCTGRIDTDVPVIAGQVTEHSIVLPSNP